MQIKSLASGSTGNCYWVSDGQTQILIECGISIKEIKKGLNYKLHEVSGCLISHGHADHSKAWRELTKAGVNLYMTLDTFFTLNNADGYRINYLGKLPYRIGTLQIIGFDTAHDCPGSSGFLVYTATKRLLYASDTFYIRHRFEGLTHVLVECNYDDQTLQENIDSGHINPSLAMRIQRSHMGLETLLDFFAANDLSQIQEIYLIHLSNGNANEARIKEAVQRATGKRVIVC